MRLLQSCLIAFSLYSKIPVPQVRWQKDAMAYALCFFPCVGVVIGFLLYGWLSFAQWLHFGTFLTAVGAVILPLLLSGGIHLDGFCDTSDALSSRQGRERKLEILTDSHIGAFAVIACILYLLLFCALWDEVILTGAAKGILCLAPVLSRSLSGFAAVTFRNAKTGGLLATFSHAADSRKVQWVTLIWILGSVLCLILLAPGLGLWVILCSSLVFLYYRVMSYRQFGGITGDLAGFFLQICELVILFTVVIYQKIGGLL